MGWVLPLSLSPVTPNFPYLYCYVNWCCNFAELFRHPCWWDIMWTAFLSCIEDTTSQCHRKFWSLSLSVFLFFLLQCLTTHYVMGLSCRWTNWGVVGNLMVIYPLHLVQLWVSIIVSTYCKIASLMRVWELRLPVLTTNLSYS